jgi:hypothetical protein
MKKSVIVLLALAFSSSFFVPAQATEKPSVVVIDSGFDSDLFSPIKEVCILTTAMCNNGKSFDESFGSSDTSIALRSSWKSEWDHGTKMADIVRQINPNANIILIRNAIVLPSGAINVGGTREFELSLQWVKDNAKKYNISAVSFSRGSNAWVRTGKGCPIEVGIQSKIADLQSLGIATVIAAGNNGDKVNVSYPGCIPEAVTISGIYSQNYTPKIWSSYRETRGTNSGILTDFFAMGNFNTIAGPVAESTSSSAAAFAGYWSKVWNGSYTNTYNKIATESLQRFVNVLQ